MKKRNQIVYYVVTGLFTAHMLLTIGVYFFKAEMVREMFTSLGVPGGLVYPLATVKLLGLIAIWTNKSRLLKELAYAGFAIDFIMAAVAHTMAADGGTIAPIIALVVVVISFLFHRKVFVKEG